MEEVKEAKQYADKAKASVMELPDTPYKDFVFETARLVYQ